MIYRHFEPAIVGYYLPAVRRDRLFPVKFIGTRQPAPLACEFEDSVHMAPERGEILRKKKSHAAVLPVIPQSQLDRYSHVRPVF